MTSWDAKKCFAGPLQFVFVISFISERRRAERSSRGEDMQRRLVVSFEVLLEISAKSDYC